MRKSMPWRWANGELDLSQKHQDYQNIVEYIKIFYNELNNIDYLDQRMVIYKILSDIKLLPRFNNNEDKEKEVENYKKLLEILRKQNKCELKLLVAKKNF